MKKNQKEHIMYILGILFVTIILLLPFIISPYMENDDTWFHIMNIGLIKRSIEENFWNGFTLRILPFVGNNLGYGTRLFYPPLAHTIGAYLTYFTSFFNLNILDSLKIFHFLGMFLSGLTMYFCAYRFHKEKFSSFLSAVIYMASSYHLSEIYVRDALGESLIFSFLPLIILSIKELLEGNKKLFYPCFIIGYVGGILSHFTMMIYITLILGASMLFYSKKIFKKEFLIPFIKGCIVVFLLTAFFFEPMIEHKLRGHYMVYKKWYMSLGIWHTALWGFEYIFDNPLPTTTMSYRFAITTLILLGITIYKNKKELFKKNYKLVTIFLLFSVWASTRYFPWLFMPYMLFMIQFGWRLVILVIFGVAILAPIAFKKNKNKLLKIVVVILIIISGLIMKDNQRNELDLNKINYAAIMGWQQEYLPENIGAEEESKKYFENKTEKIELKKGNGEVTTLENKVPYLKFQVETEEKVTLELPRIFYFGYILKNEQQEKIKLIENENGFLSCEVTKGTYTLNFEGTLPYKICRGISLASLLVLSFYIGIKIIKKEKRNILKEE